MIKPSETEHKLGALIVDASNVLGLSLDLFRYNFPFRVFAHQSVLSSYNFMTYGSVMLHLNIELDTEQPEKVDIERDKILIMQDWRILKLKSSLIERYPDVARKIIINLLEKCRYRLVVGKM